MKFRGRKYRISLSSGEIIIPLIALLFVLSYYFEVINLSPKTLLLVKPTLYLCFILSLFIFFKDGIKVSKIPKSAPPTLEHNLPGLAKKIGILLRNKTARVILITPIAFLAIEKLGFIPIAFLYIIFTMYLLGQRKVLIFIFIPPVILLAIYFVFQVYLHVPLPMGILKGVW